MWTLTTAQLVGWVLFLPALCRVAALAIGSTFSDDGPQSVDVVFVVALFIGGGMLVGSLLR